MNNLIFALNSTMPVFLVILLGYFLKRIGLINDNFNSTANTYVFKCALPISLFLSISGMDFYSDFNGRFCLFCLLATFAMFLGVWGISSILIKDKRQIGAFSQASARSSAAILGVAFATAIYGDSGMVPMMVMASVPFFNVLSVLILCFSPQVDENGLLIKKQNNDNAVKRACINVLKNPLIIGIVLGIPFSVLRITIPAMLEGALKSVGGTATPIALIVIGASFSGSEALTRLKPAFLSAFIKLLLLPAVFLPIAALLGFRNSEMFAIFIMTGSPTTVSSYVMARNMHADRVLTSNTVLLSTILSAFSITLWLFILKTFGLI